MRAGPVIALVALAIVSLGGCANHYIFIHGDHEGDAGVSEVDQAIAVSIAREVARDQRLRERVSRVPVPGLLASFDDGSVSVQVWSPGDTAPLEFSIGELGAWGETARTEAIREMLLARLGTEIPHIVASVSARRRLLPQAP